MSTSVSVQDFIDRQPRLAWRRRLVRGLIRTVGFRLLWRVEATGLQHIPASGPTILMMNHISAIDPVVCMGIVTERFVIPMTKAEALSNPIMAPFVRMWGAYTINRGEVDRKALTNSIELLKSGQVILIAPEGTRHPEGLSRPKDGLAYIASKADAYIIPTAVSDAERWGERLKRLRRCTVRINFGRPFKFKTAGRRRLPREELAAMTEEAMYQLALAVVDESKRGVYTDVSKATTNYLEFTN